jgi:hypothetical protein
MKRKTVLLSLLILTGVLMTAFGSPSAASAVKFQDTPAPTQPAVTQVAVTVVPPTVIVITTPGVIPVTGSDSPTGLWTLVLFGLLALLGIAFLVALFSPRTIRDDNDRTLPPDV